MAALYVAVGTLGALCIVMAVVGGDGTIAVGGQTITLPRKLSKGERRLLFIIGVLFLIAAVVLPSVKFGGGSPAQAGTRNAASGGHGGTPVSSSPTTTPTTTTSTTKSSTTTTSTTPPRTTPVYLSYLKPQGGDTPMRGDTHIGDRDFPHSIFYDNIPSNQSNAQVCQNVSGYTCQATDYSIATAAYHQFSAMLGVTGCSGDTATWSLIVDNVVIKSNNFAVTSSPQPIAVAIPRGNDLELLVSSTGFSGAACGPVNIIWGNAKLS